MSSTSRSSSSSGLLRCASALALLSLVAGSAQAQRWGEPFERLPGIIVPPKFNPEDFAAITAGRDHSCAIKNNGNVYCWGRNDLGQVGTGPASSCSGVACVGRPSFVMAAASVDAGSDHTCSLDGAGAAFCWGNSNYGQLGNGNYGYQTQPIPVASNGVKFRTLSAGQFSTCANSATHGMFCWGVIQNGWSGVPLPQQVFAWASYDQLSVGYNHACAISYLGNLNQVDCWGNNHYGQSAVDPAIIPSPLPPTIGTAFAPSYRVSAESYYTCADLVAGSVQCAGFNQYGQLGNGSSGGFTHVPQNVGGGRALRGVSTGTNHACALDPQGLAFCWGNGYWGQLGNGASGVFTAPQPVGGGRTYRAIAAGNRHTCAIGTDNHVYCWGNNHYGQLGTQYPGGWVWSPVQSIDP
jgi:alpha-tubulin suppressor-like RCC1 family protein